MVDHGVDCCIVFEVVVARFGSGGLCVYPGMGMRVFYPRFAVGRIAPSAMLLMDSFAYLRAPWGRECYVQQVLEHLFFSGTIAVAVVLGGATLARGDYGRMYELAVDRFSMHLMRRVVLVSMGNDLISSMRPMTISMECVPDILSELRRVRGMFASCEAALVYGGSGSTWGYATSVLPVYDRQVNAVISEMGGIFDYVSSGVDLLKGVSPVDAIGHLDVADAFRCGHLLLSALSQLGLSRRSRL